MMNALAPFNIDSIRVSEASFSVEEQPADTMTMDLGIDMGVTEVQMAEVDDLYVMNVDLTVRADLCNSEDKEDKRLRSMVKVVVRLSMARGFAGDDEACEWLKRNAVSLAYSHARSYLMALAALSPMRQFILPPVMPEAIIENAEKEADADKS